MHVCNTKQFISGVVFFISFLSGPKRIRSRKVFREACFSNSVHFTTQQSHTHYDDAAGVTKTGRTGPRFSRLFSLVCPPAYIIYLRSASTISDPRCSRENYCPGVPEDVEMKSWIFRSSSAFTSSGTDAAHTATQRERQYLGC